MHGINNFKDAPTTSPHTSVRQSARNNLKTYKRTIIKFYTKKFLLNSVDAFEYCLKLDAIKNTSY